MKSTLITIMIGNTHTSCRVWGADILSAKTSQQECVPASVSWLTAEGKDAHATAEGPAKFYEPLLNLANPGAPVVLASVVPAYQPLLEAWLRKSGYDVRIFRKDIQPPMEVAPQPPEKVGDDRIAAAFGAFAIHPADPSIVVDAGTALTVNAVTPAQGGKPARFEGGVIMPGLELMLAALAGNTGQLPRLEADQGDTSELTPEKGALGLNTEQAMRLGVRHAVTGGAVMAAALQAAHLNITGTVRILLTGGGARQLEAAFKRIHSAASVELQPHLVHIGLAAAFHMQSATS